MAAEELRNAIDSFDYRQYLKYKGLSDDEIPETLDDGQKRALFRRAHEDAYADMVKAYKADPFMDNEAAQDKAREDLLRGRDYLRPLFGLWEEQRTAEELYKPETVIGEALRQNGIDVSDPNFNIESIPESIRFKEMAPYIEQYANSIVNDNLKYNAPELAGINKKTFIENFRNINGISNLDTINDLLVNTVRRNAERARQERIANGEESSWSWVGDALDVGSAGGAGMMGNSAVIAGSQGNRLLDWMGENPIRTALGSAGIASALSLIPGVGQLLGLAAGQGLSTTVKEGVDYINPENNSWLRRNLMELETEGMRLTNEAARVRNSLNYVPKYDRLLEDYAKDWDFVGFMGRLTEQAASNWPSVAQNIAVPLLGGIIGTAIGGPVGTAVGLGLTTTGSFALGAPLSAGDAVADLADHGVYDTFEQNRYLPYVSAAVTLDYLSTLALHSGFSGLVGRGVNAGIGAVFTSRAERDAAKAALKKAAQAQGMNWNTIQSVAGRQLLKLRAAELAGASTKLGKTLGKASGPLMSFLEEMYTEQAQEDIAMQLMNYGTSSAFTREGGWESLRGKFLEGGLNPRNWSPVPFWGRESMFAQYEDGATYNPRMYNERLLSAGLVGGLMGGGTHVFLSTEQAIVDKLTGRSQKQDGDVIVTDANGNTMLMRKRQEQRDLARSMFATMQALGKGVNAQTVVGVDLQDIGGAYVANFNGVTGTGADPTSAFIDLSVRANQTRQDIDSTTIAEVNGGWEATLANNEKLRVVGTNAEQVLRDLVNIHNSRNHPWVINRGATIEYVANSAKPWKITRANGVTVRAETLYDNYAFYDFSTNASGNFITDTIIRRKGKQDIESKIDLSLTQTGTLTFTDQFQNIQNSIANSNGKLILLDATRSKKGTKNPRVKVNGSVTNDTMRILDVESGIIYTLKLKKGRRNSNAHVNVSATSLDGRKIRLDPSVAKQTLRDASNSSALTNEIRLSTPSTGITIQGETVAGQPGWHFKADQIAEITRLTGAQLMSDSQRTDHLEFSIPSWVEGREQMEMLVLDIDQNGKVFATANGETIEIDGINDRYTGEFANETAGRILAETEDTLQVQALTGGTFEMVGNPDASTGAVTLRRQTAAGSTIEVTIDRRGNLTNFRLVDDPSIDLQTRIDEGITRRNQRTQAQQTQQAQLGQISDPDLATFTEEDLVQLGLNPATINAELKTNLNNNISSALQGGATFAKIEANLEKMGFPPGRFLYQDVLGGGHWVLRDRDGKVIGHYTNDKRGLTDLQHMSHARIEAAFGTNNIIPYVLEQFVDGIRNRGYTTDVTNVTNEDYTRALEKYLSYYDAVFGPEQESYVSSTDRETLVRQRLQQRWQDIYDGRVILSTIQDVLKFYGNYIQRGYRLYDYMTDSVLDSNFNKVELTDVSAFINERDANSAPKRENVGLIETYMIGNRIYDRKEILKAAHQKNNLDTIQYDQMENLAQQELQKYTETPSVRARRGERRYIDRLNGLIREETAPLLLMNNLDDVIAYYEGKGGSVGIYRTYIDHATGMYIGKDGQQYSKVDINTSDVARQLVRWENNTKPSIASNAAEEGYFLQRPDGSQVIAHEVLALVGVDRGTFMETLKRADTMMAFLDTVETNDRVNDALAQETQEAEATALTRQEAEDQIIAELFEQAQVASTGADFLELYRGQLQKRYVVRDLDNGQYKGRSIDSVDLNSDNFLHEDEVRNITLPTNYDIVGYWVLFNSDGETIENFDTDVNFVAFSNRLRNQDMLDFIDREELITRRVEESEVSVGQQNARRETLRQQREAVAAQAQAAAQAAQQPSVNPASAPQSIPYAETLVRMFGNEAIVSLSNKVMLYGDSDSTWNIRDARYELLKKKGEHGARNVNDPNQSLDREMRGSFAAKLWRSALRRRLVRTYKTAEDFWAANPQLAEQLYLQYGRGMVAAARRQELRTVAPNEPEVLNYVNALTDEQKAEIRANHGTQGHYNKDNGTIDLVEENIPNEMGVTVFFHELAVHATSHLTKDLNVAWERIANFLRTQAKGTINANGKKVVNKIGAAVWDIINNRSIHFNEDEWGYWEEVAAYFVADHINNLSFAQNIKALFRRWFRQTGIIAQGEDITVEDILHFARHAAKVGISRGNSWKTANEGKSMHAAFSAIGSIYHTPENVVRDQMGLLYQHYQEDRNMDMMGMVYDRATGLAQHSNLNRARWLLVRTPFYKHWFGDWENDPQRASKVVDGNGEPLLVPHAKKHDAIAYDLPFTGFNGNFGYSGQYTYGTISDNPYLDRFSGSGIAQVFLNVRKPLHAHNYSHMSQTMRRLGFQESTMRLDLRSMLNDMVEDTEAHAVVEGITRYSEDENPRGSFSDFLILNDDLLATVFPNATMREAHRFVTGLFEAATTPSGSILVEEPVTGASTTEEYAESLGEEERRHLAEAADIFDRHLEGFENQMVRLSYNPDGYFTAFSRAHDDVSMSTRETITDVLGAIDQRAQEYREADMLTFKEAVARAYEEISALQESEISNDEAFLNILNLALHKLRREELAVRLGIEPRTLPAYPTMPTRMMLKENNLQLAERLRGEMLRQGFDGLWGTDDILLLHPDQAHEALEFVQPYGDVSTGTQGVTMTPYERSIMEAVEDNLAREAERLDVPLVRLRSEYRSIYQAFAPSAPWIKSNLDEYNWVLVRTPSFKENFGDWQNDATEDMWLDWRDEPVRTGEGFLNGETVIRTEEGYFSSIGPSAFGRLAGTQAYTQAIDQAALENLFGVTDLTEERIALEQQIRDLQTQDAELVTRIQAIQAQIAAVQAQIPNVQDRQPEQVFADPQLIAERDALLARQNEITQRMNDLRQRGVQRLGYTEESQMRDRLDEIQAEIALAASTLQVYRNRLDDLERRDPYRYNKAPLRRIERISNRIADLRDNIQVVSAEIERIRNIIYPDGVPTLSRDYTDAGLTTQERLDRANSIIDELNVLLTADEEFARLNEIIQSEEEYTPSMRSPLDWGTELRERLDYYKNLYNTITNHINTFQDMIPQIQDVAREIEPIRTQIETINERISERERIENAFAEDIDSLIESRRELILRRNELSDHMDDLNLRLLGELKDSLIKMREKLKGDLNSSSKKWGRTTRELIREVNDAINVLENSGVRARELSSERRTQTINEIENIVSALDRVDRQIEGYSEEIVTELSGEFQGDASLAELVDERNRLIADIIRLKEPFGITVNFANPVSIHDAISKYTRYRDNYIQERIAEIENYYREMMNDQRNEVQEHSDRVRQAVEEYNNLRRRIAQIEDKYFRASERERYFELSELRDRAQMELERLERELMFRVDTLPNYWRNATERITRTVDTIRRTEDELRTFFAERINIREQLQMNDNERVLRMYNLARETIIAQVADLNRQIREKFERQSEVESALKRRKAKSLERIMRKQAELQTKNTDTLRELANVTDVLNTIREDIRNRPGRAADEARAAQLMLGAERLENEKWEFIDEMAEMIWEVSRRLGNVNAVIRDNPGASQTALNAMNARKADLISELDNLRYQVLNGSSKLDDDIIVARQEAQELLQLVDPLTEQTVSDLESQQDEIIARQQEIEVELDVLDERLMNLTGTASEVVNAMKDGLLEQLDQLNAQRGALAVRQTELSRQKTLTQRAIDQRNSTLTALNRVDAYALAGQLEAMGYSAEHIKLVTGFERDEEDNWTYHLSNRDAVYTNPITIVERRFRELLKRAGIRANHTANSKFKRIRDLSEQYHQFYVEGDNSTFRESIGEELHEEMANFVDWFIETQEERLRNALQKRGISVNLAQELFMNIPLSEIYSDDNLFTAYPELRNTCINLWSDKGLAKAGSASMIENKLSFNLAHKKTATDYMSNIIHEIQHKIQHWENWARGTNPDAYTQSDEYKRTGDDSFATRMAWYLREYGEFTARYAGATWNMTNEELRAYNQDKFLDKDNKFWTEWWKEKFQDVSFSPISRDQLRINTSQQESSASSIMPHGQQRNPVGFKTQYPTQRAENERLTQIAESIRKEGLNSAYFSSTEISQRTVSFETAPMFSALGNVFGRTSNYNLDIYDREEIQGSGGAYKLRDGRIFIDPNEVGEENVARIMLYALIRENNAILNNENIARAVAIIREWENSPDDTRRNLYNRIRNSMNAVHAPDSALLAYAVREFMADGTSAINPTEENSPEGVFAAILREIPAIMGQAAGVSTSQVTAMPSDVITVTNALSGINNDTIDVAVPSLNVDQRTFEALETKATAPAFMDTVMQSVKGILDEYDNAEFQFINGMPHLRMGDLVLNLATDPMFARNIVDQLIQNTVDMGNHDLTDRQNPGEEQDESLKLFGDLAKRLPQNAQLLGNARQADVEKFIKDNIPEYIANRIRVFYEETDESKAIFGEEYNGRFKPLMADREVIFIKAYGNRSLADVVGTTVKMVSMFGWNMWNNADFVPLMNELYTALEHNIRTELPSYYNKIRGRKPNSSEKAALISAYLASKSTSIYELGEFARSNNVPTTREQEIIDLGKRLRTEIDKVSLHMAESFASDFSQNEELVKEYTEKLLRLTMAPFHGQGIWLAYDLDYDRVRQTNPDASLALQKWENLSRVTVFANDFGPTYTAEPVTDEAISNAMMVRKFRNASPFMQKVWRLYWRNWHPPQKHIGDTILGTENTVMLGRAFHAVTEDMGISMRNVFQHVAQFKEELLREGVDTEEFDGRKGYEQELRDRGITKEKLIDKAVIVDTFLRFGHQRMLENVIEIRRLITANTQKLDFWMRRENVPERQIQRMHAEMNAFANKFVSDWEHRSYRAYTEQGQDDLTEMYRIIDGSKGRTNFGSAMSGIVSKINTLEQQKSSGQISNRAYARERKNLRHQLKLYERLDALYNWVNQTVMARLPARPSQAQAANVPKDTIEAMKKEIQRVQTLVLTEKERGVGGRMELIPAVRKRKLDERNPHDKLYMTFLDQVKDPATAMLYNLDQQGKIMDKMIFNTRFGESILQNGMGSMRGSQESTGLKVNNLSWMENGTFLRYVQIDPFFLDEIANEMKIQDALRDTIIGHLINLIKQNFTVLNWRMSISNWIGNLSNLIATGQIFRFRNWRTGLIGMNKDKFVKNFIVDFDKTVKGLTKKDCEDAIDAAAREYNANIAQYQSEMNKLNIWGSGLTSAQIDAYGQGGWEKVSDFLGATLQTLSDKTKGGFFDDVSREKMARRTGIMMRYAREFYGFGDEWVKPLTYINNRAVAMAKHRAMNNWSRFEGRENEQTAIELDKRIREEAVREAALLTLKETTTWELSPDFARKITRNAARVIAPDFLLHQFQMVRIMAVNTQRIFECADEVARLNAKGKKNWTPDEKIYYSLVNGEMIRRGIGSSMMTAAFALMFTSAFSLSGYLVNLIAGSLAGSGDSLEKRKRKTRDPNGAVGMDARDFEGTTKLCNVISMISDLYAPIIWVPGKVGKEFYAYNDQRVNAAYTTAMVRPPSVNPSAMERLKNLALTLVNMESVPLTVQLVNLWHGKNSFGQNITATEAIWETLSLLTPQIFHQGYYVVQGADRAMLGTEDLGWREKNRHRELSVFDIGGIKVRRVSVDDIIENTGRKVKQLTNNENANRRVFLDTLQRNPDMSDRDIKIAVDKILASNKLEMDKIAYAMSAFRDIGVDRDRLLKRLTWGRNTTSPILSANRANQLIEGRDVLSLILLTNLSERIKSIEGNLDPDTDFSKDERRKVIRNLRTAMRMIQEAEK